MSFSLRPYQEAAVAACLDDLKTHNKLAMVLPTSAGKTIIFIEICRRFIEEDPSRCVFVLSHLSLLTEQTKRKYEEQAPNILTGIMQGNRKPRKNDQVIIGTMQTAARKHRLESQLARMIKKPALIIVDEAHRMLCESYENIFASLPDCKLIGVTATPFKESKIMTNSFEKVSYTISLQELIDQGYIVPPKLYEIERCGDDANSIAAQVIGTYRECEMGNQAIIFMKTVEDAEQLRNAFVADGIACERVTAETKERDGIFRDFANSKINVLTTVDVLTAGFDAPNVGAIFMPYSTKSATQYMQRIGRGLRLYPGKRECRVYVYGSAPSISKELYKKLQAKVLTQGGGFVEFETFTDTLEFNDDDSVEVYKWTSQVVDIVKRLKSIGQENLSQLLNHKQFPTKYLQDVQSLLSKLPKSKTSSMSALQSASEKQTALLNSRGFTESVIQKLSKLEASTLIYLTSENVNDEFTVQSGLHAGKHISQLPPYYRNLVIRNYPFSKLSRLIKKWTDQQKGR